MNHPCLKNYLDPNIISECNIYVVCRQMDYLFSLIFLYSPKNECANIFYQLIKIIIKFV